MKFWREWRGSIKFKNGWRGSKFWYRSRGHITGLRQKNAMGLNILLFNHTLQNTFCLLKISFI